MEADGWGNLATFIATLVQHVVIVKKRPTRPC